MTKLILAAAVLPVAMLAQIPAGGAAFQQESWIRPANGVLGLSDMQRIEGQSGPVMNRPLSADEVRTSVQTLSDGSHLNKSETNRFYRDAQGRMMTKTATGAVIYDPVAGFSYDLTDRNKTYTKSAIPANATVTIAAAAHYSSVSSHSGVTTKDRTIGAGSGGQQGQRAFSAKAIQLTSEDPELPQSINGIFAKGSRVTSTIRAGSIGNDADLKVVNDRWVSDDLKLLVKSSNSDPRFGVTTYELKNIAQTAPDPALFQIPADYKEASR